MENPEIEPKMPQSLFSPQFQNDPFVAARLFSLDHFIRPHKHIRRNRQADLFRSL